MKYFEVVRAGGLWKVQFKCNKEGVVCFWFRSLAMQAARALDKIGIEDERRHLAEIRKKYRR
jgi:hypothetical protein